MKCFHEGLLHDVLRQGKVVNPEEAGHRGDHPARFVAEKMLDKRRHGMILPAFHVTPGAVLLL
jgi:hypothetical protein